MCGLASNLWLTGSRDRVALSVGEQYNPASVRSNDWRAFAKHCDIGAHYFDTLIKDLANRLSQTITPTREAFESRYAKAPQLQRVREIVRQQCQRVLRN